MIELPEARTIANDLKKEILGKKIIDVSGNYTDHKFTFYYDDPNKYKEMLMNKKITKINERNFYIEMEIEDCILLLRDGANIRYYEKGVKTPSKSKLLLKFEDASFINITTSMYCFISVFKKDLGIDDLYYDLELNGVGVLDSEFTLDYFKGLITNSSSKLSVKAFLATKQRILGIGNGVVQDIMFNARLYPKRKIETLNHNEIERLYYSTVETITNMVKCKGRDTEKNIYGQDGKYKTILSNKTYKDGCPKCNGTIKKEQYLGGSIYYCPICQK